MKTADLGTLAAAVVACGSGLVAWNSWRSPAVAEPRASAISPVSGASARFVPESLEVEGRRVAGRNPFRLSRQASSVRFDPTGAYTPPPPPPAPPPRPDLSLVGLILGDRPSAIVEGLPDRPGGAVLAIGEELGGILFQALRGDSAVLIGYDTLWVLAPRGYVP